MIIEGAEQRGSRVRHRLGIVGLPGFAPVPHLLLLHQARLGLSAKELNVVLNIFMHWHTAEELPFPATSTIAKRMGVRRRAVQDVIKSLTDRGYIERIPGRRRRDPTRYDVRPLLNKLVPQAKKWAVRNERELPTPKEIKFEDALDMD